MTKDQFLKLEDEYGFNFAIEELRNEEIYIADQDRILELMAEEIADFVGMGYLDKAQKYLNRLLDYGGVEYWYFNYKDRGLPKPIATYEDVQFLLTDD